MSGHFAILKYDPAALVLLAIGHYFNPERPKGRNLLEETHELDHPPRRRDRRRHGNQLLRLRRDLSSLSLSGEPHTGSLL